MRLASLCFFSLLALCACAGQRPLAETQLGAAAPDGFYVSGPPGAARSALERIVVEALSARGFREASDTTARYVVEVAYADRPRGVAALAPSGVVAPRPPPRGIRTLFSRSLAELTIRIAERTTGRVVYRGTARLPHRRPLPADAPHLVAAALDGLGRARAGSAGRL